MDPQGLDDDKAARIILQYRNTPTQGTDLFPQHNSNFVIDCDFLPSLPILSRLYQEWIIVVPYKIFVVEVCG